MYITNQICCKYSPECSHSIVIGHTSQIVESYRLFQKSKLERDIFIPGAGVEFRGRSYNLPAEIDGGNLEEISGP